MRKRATKRPGRDNPAESKPPTAKRGVVISFYTPDADEAIVVIYDLSDPDAWERAGRERRAWGRERTVVHPLTNDVIAVEFKPGGARELSA